MGRLALNSLHAAGGFRCNAPRTSSNESVMAIGLAEVGCCLSGALFMVTGDGAKENCGANTAEAVLLQSGDFRYSGSILSVFCRNPLPGRLVVFCSFVLPAYSVFPVPAEDASPSPASACGGKGRVGDCRLPLPDTTGLSRVVSGGMVFLLPALLPELGEGCENGAGKA